MYYRHLNAQTVKNKHPMPVVEELLDELAGAKWSTKLNFRAGCHQICIEVAATHKTAFKTHNVLYEFFVMPFGLTNAPTTFLSVKNLIFDHLLRKGVLVFMDDILVYSETLSDHLELLKRVCEVEYLGHTILAQGVSTEIAKIQAVKDWPTPRNLNDLRGFLGLTGYYRRFIKHYGLMSRPLSNLLKKGVSFVWTSVTDSNPPLKKWCFS